MRKTRNTTRSRIIRKWDGTLVADTTPPSDHIDGTAPPPTAAPTKSEDLIFEFAPEDELSDTLDVDR